MNEKPVSRATIHGGEVHVYVPWVPAPATASFLRSQGENSNECRVTIIYPQPLVYGSDLKQPRHLLIYDTGVGFGVGRENTTETRYDSKTGRYEKVIGDVMTTKHEVGDKWWRKVSDQTVEL
jgi:hypothetical protein